MASDLQRLFERFENLQEKKIYCKVFSLIVSELAILVKKTDIIMDASRKYCATFKAANLMIRTSVSGCLCSHVWQVK